MGILAGVVFGLIAGAVAKLVMPGPDPAGQVGSILIGGGGAVIGSALGSLLLGASWTAFDGRGFMLGVIGSLIVLVGYRAFAYRAAP